MTSGRPVELCPWSGQSGTSWLPYGSTHTNTNAATLMVVTKTVVMSIKV